MHIFSSLPGKTAPGTALKTGLLLSGLYAYSELFIPARNEENSHAVASLGQTWPARVSDFQFTVPLAY